MVNIAPLPHILGLKSAYFMEFFEKMLEMPLKTLPYTPLFDHGRQPSLATKGVIILLVNASAIFRILWYA